MSPTIYRRAAELVRLRKAQTFSEACSMLAKLKVKRAGQANEFKVQPVLRLPYKDE